MEICFVSTFPPQQCGIGTYTQNLRNALIARGHSVYVLAEVEGQETARDTGVFRVWNRRADYDVTILRTIKSSPTKPDIVHIQHEYGIFRNDARLRALESGLIEMGIPYVITLHTVFNDLGPIPSIYGRGVIIVHTEIAKTMIVSRTSLLNDIVVIPHGVHFATPPITNASKVSFKTLGFVSQSKGLEEILSGFQMLNVLSGVHEWDYTIRGRCQIEYQLELENFIFNCGLTDRVKFTPGFYKAGEESITSDDIVVLGNLDGNTYSASGQMAHALGLGVRIVAKRAPIYEDLSEVLYYRDAGELASILRGLTAAEIRRRPRSWYSKAPYGSLSERSWSNVAARHVAMYNEVVDGGK